MPHCGGAYSCNCVVTGDGVSGSGTLSDPYVITSVPEGGGVTDHGALTGLGDDDHAQYALADGTRGAFAAPLGADDNYVTDAEKAALHGHSNKAALDLVSGTNTGDQVLPTWSTISGKPAVVAAGATQAAARTAIGAGTSSFSGAYADLTGKPTTMTPTAHASTHAAAGSDPVTLTSAQIGDLTETVQDIVGAFLVAGTNVTVTYNDAANTFTINATASGGSTDPEIVRDVIGAAMVAGSGVQITVNDAADTITIASTAVLPTRQIISGTGLTGGGDLSADRTLSVAYGTTAGTAAQGNDSRLSDARTPTAHTHDAGDIAGDARWIKSASMIDPDRFPGTDAQRVQAAIDYAIANGYPSVGFTRQFTITGATLTINKAVWNDRRVLNLVGLGGGLVKHDAGAMLTSGTANTGDMCAVGMLFVSTAGANTIVWDGDKLLRFSSSQCEYRNVDRLVKQSTDSRWIQSVRFTHDRIVGGSGPAFECIESYDTAIISCLFEDRDAVWHNIAPVTSRLQNRSLRMIANIMENLSGLPIKLGPCWTTTISHNYFEANQSTTAPAFFSGQAVHIDTYTIQPATGHAGLAIEGNMFSMSTVQRAAKSPAVLVGQAYDARAAAIRLAGNVMDSSPLYWFGNVDQAAISGFGDYSRRSDLGDSATRFIAAPVHAHLLPAYLATSGATAARPVSPPVGFTFFDNTLGKPISCRYRGTTGTITLTITAGATSAGNATVTIGTTTLDVALAAGDSVTAVRDKIAALIQAGRFYPYTATVSGADVITIGSVALGPIPATRTLTGSTGAAGTFAAGAAGQNAIWVDATGAIV